MPKARLQSGSRNSQARSFPPAAVPAGPQLPSPRPGADSPGRAPRVEGEEAAAGSLRWQRLAASSPPRRGSRGRPRGQERCDWPAAAGGGARRAGVARTASKEPRILQSALEPWPARSLPGAGRLGLGNSGLLWLTRFLQTTGSYMPLYPPLPLHVPMLLRQQQVRAAVFSSFSLAASVSWGMDSGRPVPYPTLPRCSRGAQLSHCCSAHPRSGVPDHAYIVCVRTRTSPELKILRHAWNS